MIATDMLQNLLTELGEAERHLLRSHRVRLNVDKVTADGRNALCSAAQIHRRLLRPDHLAEEGVAACHQALSSLHRIGLTPLIGWLPRDASNTFFKIDPQDPFRLRMALSVAGISYRLLSDEAQVQRFGTYG